MRLLLWFLSRGYRCNRNAIDGMQWDPVTIEIANIVQPTSADRQNMPPVFCRHHAGWPNYAEA